VIEMNNREESVCPWCGAPFKEFWEYDRESGIGMGGPNGHNWKCGSSRNYGVTVFDKVRKMGIVQKDTRSDACIKIGRW
jgi:hypothetical protein